MVEDTRLADVYNSDMQFGVKCSTVPPLPKDMNKTLLEAVKLNEQA